MNVRFVVIVIFFLQLKGFSEDESQYAEMMEKELRWTQALGHAIELINSRITLQAFLSYETYTLKPHLIGVYIPCSWR